MKDFRISDEYSVVMIVSAIYIKFHTFLSILCIIMPTNCSVATQLSQF